jgi:hypothetical protein
MRDDHVTIAMQVKKLLEQHGDAAVYYAEEKFFEIMQTDDINQATIWLSVLNELKEMINYNNSH